MTPAEIRPGVGRRSARMRRGVSLLEMVIVLFVIGALASMAIPRFGGSLVRYRIEQAADLVARDLSAAREFARASSSSVTVSFDSTLNRYSIPALPDPDHPNSAFQRDLSQAPYEVNISGAVFDTNKSVTFDGYGLPDNDGTVTLVVGDETRYVVVDADTGVISVSETVVFTAEVGGGMTIPLGP